ncbi:bifunctional class I SAM-dependent methyltransferase/NUDIX hydrolase [Streptomyces sp. CRN 30]|uniref:bifunctional class I SAM-dependent methyltransferase/NUDIX hydrolase n=1 Tax=Streptomyces sp. CRN 30 TaxID=3075613 RepID=UPI002A7F6432|nr:NUDIX domain-containing protein [Streptomyces sp. CRN 30]
MGHDGPDGRDGWDEFYAGGGSFRPPTDAERRLLAEHVPAPEGGGLALDVGCGLGGLARHLAGAGYEVDAVDRSAAALARAAEEAGEHGPAARTVRYLPHDIERDPCEDLPRPAYDLIVFRLSWAFVRDRTRVARRLRERLRPGGALCVITPLAADVPEDRRGIALDEEEIGLLGAGWRSVGRYDADGLALVVLRDPAPAPPVWAARGRPAPHALTGAGVVVTDPAGRVLLGWSTRGVWELPGGRTDAGEDFAAAAVRELAEETGLRAEPGAVRLLALLLDSVDAMPRVTAAVHVPRWSGEPAVTEPRLIHRWEWHEPADLPALGRPLFTPSAHVLDTYRPGLFPGLPAVHRYPLAPGGPARTDRPGDAPSA